MTSDNLALSVGKPRKIGLRGVLDSISSLLERRRLVYRLTLSTLRKEGQDTLLGNLWWVLDPALQLFVYYLLVQVIFRQNQPAVLLFLAATILPWKWFAASLNSATNSVRSKEQIMRQVAFPHLVLPAATMLSNFMSFLFAIVPLMTLYLLYPERLTIWAVAIIPVALVQFCVTLPFVVLFSSLGVFFRDVSIFIPHALRVWFYLSPALFSFEVLRAIGDQHPWFNLLINLNPFTWIFNGYRDALYYGRSPDWFSLAVVAIASVPFTLLAIYLFRRSSPLFVKVL